MNKIVKINTLDPSCAGNTFRNTISMLDTKSLLILGGMTCLTTIICVGCVSFSGSEMTISKDGFFIKRPIIST